MSIYKTKNKCSQKKRLTKVWNIHHPSRPPLHWGPLVSLTDMNIHRLRRVLSSPAAAWALTIDSLDPLLLPKFFGIGKATWQQGTVLLALIEGMALCDDDSIGEHDQDSVEAIVFLSLKIDCVQEEMQSIQLMFWLWEEVYSFLLRKQMGFEILLYRQNKN